MSELIDLDFENTATNNSNVNPNILPLGTEALISYNSPTGEKRKNNNNNNNNKNNSNTNTGNSLFDDLGIQDHNQQSTNTEDAKPLSESDILKKFSSPPTHK